MKKLSKSSERYTFQKENYIKRCKKDGKEPSQSYLEMYNNMSNEKQSLEENPEWHNCNLESDLRSTTWMLEKVRASDTYAQNLYAAMCNRAWQEHAVWPILQGETWSCSWRYAGGIVARLRGEGDYMDWYCSGIRDAEDHAREGTVTEGVVTPEIEKDLAALGWRPVDEPHDHV